MNNLLAKLIGVKKDWKRMEARAGALPGDYRAMYGEIQSYLWCFASGDGRDVLEVLRGVLTEFESAADEGRPALAVTGPDVAAYCDARLPRCATYLDKWRADLNRRVATKV